MYRDRMTLSFLTKRKGCIFSITLKNKTKKSLSHRGSYTDKLHLPLILVIQTKEAFMNHVVSMTMTKYSVKRLLTVKILDKRKQVFVPVLRLS